VGGHLTNDRRAPRLVCDRNRDCIARPNAGIRQSGRKGTSQEHDGADEEQGGCADLDGDQGMPRAARTRVPRDFATHRADQFDARGLQRRHESERNGRDGRAGKKEHQHPPVRRGDAEIHLLREFPGHRRGRHVKCPFQEQPGNGITARRRRERKDEAFRQELTDDSPA